MLLNMKGSTNRKPKTEANLQDDAVLGELLGEIKTSASNKSGNSSAPLSSKPKLASSNLNTNSSASHSNPFAVRPASTGLMKKKCPVEKPAVPVKTEAFEDDDTGKV